MNLENLNIWCWIIPALVGIISGILGYLIGKGSSTSIDNSAELDLLKGKNSKLEADLEACQAKLATKISSPKVAPVSTLIPFNAQAALTALGKKVKQDDLKIIEGIGPKIEQLFNANGIKTWKDLSETAVAKCQEVLDSGGDSYKIHDPASWPMQARMCYEGKWKELALWQEEHKHGKF